MVELCDLFSVLQDFAANRADFVSGVALGSAGGLLGTYDLGLGVVVDDEVVIDIGFDQIVLGDFCLGPLRLVCHLAVVAVEARLLLHDTGLGAIHGQSHNALVLGSVMTAVTEQDVAIAAVGLPFAIRKLAIFDRKVGDCTLLGHDADRSAVSFCVFGDFGCCAIVKGTVVEGDVLRSSGLVVDVQRNGNLFERRVLNEDISRGVGVYGGVGVSLKRRIGGAVETAAIEGDVDLAVGVGSVGEVNTLHILAVFECQVDGVSRVALAPGGNAVELLYGDGDVLVQECTGDVLCAGVTVELIGVNLKVALARRDIGAVAIDDHVVGNVAVGHGTHVGLGFAIDLGGTLGRARKDARQCIHEGLVVCAIVVHGVCSKGGVGECAAVEGVVVEQHVER